jgi:undecaprenyl-diphosphatase
MRTTMPLHALAPKFVLTRAAFDRASWSARDLAWATRLNRAVGFRWALWPLVLASRLGDGVLWYGVIGMLALLGGDRGRYCAAQMAVAGLTSLAVYLVLKRWIARPRPFVRCGDIRVCARALDQFSFPSGHTLHSVAFTTILATSFPAAAWVLWPVTVLIAASRVTLGLHYPSDVIAGALIGWTVAQMVI